MKNKKIENQPKSFEHLAQEATLNAKELLFASAFKGYEPYAMLPNGDVTVRFAADHRGVLPPASHDYDLANEDLRFLDMTGFCRKEEGGFKVFVNDAAIIRPSESELTIVQFPQGKNLPLPVIRHGSLETSTFHTIDEPAEQERILQNVNLFLHDVYNGVDQRKDVLSSNDWPDSFNGTLPAVTVNYS